jgi:hypothetical protein
MPFPVNLATTPSRVAFNLSKYLLLIAVSLR